MSLSNRAYSLLDIKEMDENTRTFTGIATTPATDLMDDVVEPKGAQFKLPIPLLWQHRADEPIGQVIEARVTDKGIIIKGRMPKVDEPGRLKDRLDEAWHTMKAGLVGGLSIGFKGVETARIEGSFGTRFIKWLWLELSAVTIAANSEASITSIKSIDTEIRAATGIKDGEHRPAPPGVTGKSLKPVNLKPQEGKTMNSTEHIAALETRQANLSASLQAIQAKVADEGRTKDASEKEEAETLKLELSQVVDELKDARDIERLMISTAKPVAAVKTVEQANDARGGYRAPVSIKTNHAKGTGFIRLIAAKWMSHQLHRPAADIARERFGDTPDVEAVLRSGFDATNIAEAMYQRTAVVAGNTTDSAWAGPLVVAQNLAGEFFEMLRASTIIGRIPNLRAVPFNISVPRALTDPTGYWVGQGDVKPVSSLTFDSVTLPFHKVAGIVPITEELARFSNPSAEGIIRSALVGALTYRVDRDFLDPSIAAVGVVNPASITNGVTPTVATGTTADAFRDDLGTMMSIYLGLNMSPSGVVLVMTSQQALKLGLMRNSLGQKEFPDISIAGGSLEGIPVVTSENIVATGGSPTDGYPIVAINAPEVMVADDGGVSIDVSREASLQMNDAPDSPETTSTVLVSLWQRNYVAFKAERFITWKKGRTGAVQYISSAKYQ